MKTLLTLAQLMAPQELPPNVGLLEQQALCGPLVAIHEQLNNKYQEVPGILWDEDETVRKGIVYFNRETQTITLVLTYPSGVGCIISSGKIKYNAMPKESSDNVKSGKGQPL